MPGDHRRSRSTLDVKQAFSSLSQPCGIGGRLAVWVYIREASGSGSAVFCLPPPSFLMRCCCCHCCRPCHSAHPRHVDVAFANVVLVFPVSSPVFLVVCHSCPCHRCYLSSFHHAWTCHAFGTGVICLRFQHLSDLPARSSSSPISIRRHLEARSHPTTPASSRTFNTQGRQRKSKLAIHKQGQRKDTKEAEKLPRCFLILKSHL